MAAVIHQINTSGGGVPKVAVSERVEIDAGGVWGDHQAEPGHGGPDKALCLFSLEVIEALQAEGHPIAPGSAGENLTIAGVDWADMRPGTVVRSGTMVAEITSAAAPCAKNARWFSDREFSRMSQDDHPGWSRWYARVIEPGEVGAGDPVEIVPAPQHAPVQA